MFYQQRMKMKKELSNYYLEPYQVFIQKKLLLQSKLEIRRYQINDFVFFQPTSRYGKTVMPAYSTVAYLVELSKKGYIHLKDIVLDVVGTLELSQYIERAENPPRMIGSLGPPVIDCSREKIILGKAKKNEKLTPEDFSRLLFARSNFYDYISFTVNFSGINTLKKELNDYIDYFREGNLIVPRNDNKEYYAYQRSAELIEECLKRKGEFQGTGNLRISLQDVDKIKHEFAESKANYPVLSVKFMETMLAMEKEGKFVILEMHEDLLTVKLGNDFLSELKNDKTNNTLLGQVNYDITKSILESAKIEQDQQSKRQLKVIPISVKKGTKWEDIKIVMISGDCISVTIGGGRSIKRHAAEMGFIDRRIGEVRKKNIWTLLTILCKKGSITWEDNTKAGWSRKEQFAVKKNISLLRGQLQKVFPGCEGTSIRYDKETGYKAIFKTACTATFFEKEPPSGDEVGDDVKGRFNEHERPSLDSRISRQQFIQDNHQDEDSDDNQ